MWKKLKMEGTERCRRCSIHIYAFTMDCDPKVKRFKKSDKAKEKMGMPSSKHARQYDAVYVKAPIAESFKKKKKK